MALTKIRKIILFAIPVISLILHWHVFKLDLVGIHVWRQTETQTVINNFYREDFNILNPRVNNHADTSRLHRMEFPIMQWIYAIFFKIFGPHIIISRILSFIIGMFSVWGMYRLSKLIFKNTTIATICAWTFNFSPAFYYYTLNPMPDNLALCMAIWYAVFFYCYIRTDKIKYIIFSAAVLGISVLAKLPFIIYGSFAAAFLLRQLYLKERRLKEVLQVAATYTLFLLPAIAWYATVIPTWTNGVIAGALDAKQKASELLYILWGNISSIFPELIINYGSLLFFIAGVYFIFRNKLYRNKNFFPFLAWSAGIILYFLYELNMIDTVHDYYLFPFLPPIFLIISYGAYKLLALRWLRILAMACLLVLPLTAFLRIDSRWETEAPGFNAAYYNHKTELRDLIPPNAYCIVGNDPSGYILLYYIDRKGWTFDYDALDEKTLEYYIAHGARYLFVDSHLDERDFVKMHIAQKIFDKETLRVYKLK